MSICSKHREREPSCDLCNATVYDLFHKKDVDKANADAEKAGLITCRCGFEYYCTTDTCPLCNRWSPVAWFRKWWALG